MLLFLSISGVLLSIHMLYSNARKFRSSVYLGLFFLVVSLYGINQYTVLYSRSLFLIAIVATNVSFLSYLIGPLLYWYVRSILTDNSRLKLTDVLHLLPMLVYLAAALPYMLTPFSYKLEIAKEILNNVGFLGSFRFTILSDIFSNMTVYLSRPILALVYTLWSVGLFIRYRVQGKKSHVLSGQIFMMKWVTVLLGFQLLLIFTHLFSVFVTFTEGSDVFFTLNTVQLLSALGMIGLLGSPLFFPGILYGLPRIPDSIFRKSSKENDSL